MAEVALAKTVIAKICAVKLATIKVAAAKAIASKALAAKAVTSKAVMTKAVAATAKANAAKAAAATAKANAAKATAATAKANAAKATVAAAKASASAAPNSIWETVRNIGSGIGIITGMTSTGFIVWRICNAQQISQLNKILQPASKFWFIPPVAEPYVHIVYDFMYPYCQTQSGHMKIYKLTNESDDLASNSLYRYKGSNKTEELNEEKKIILPEIGKQFDIKHEATNIIVQRFKDKDGVVKLRLCFDDNESLRKIKKALYDNFEKHTGEKAKEKFERPFIAEYHNLDVKLWKGLSQWFYQNCKYDSEIVLPTYDFKLPKEGIVFDFKFRGIKYCAQHLKGKAYKFWGEKTTKKNFYEFLEFIDGRAIKKSRRDNVHLRRRHTSKRLIRIITLFATSTLICILIYWVVLSVLSE